MKVYIVTADDIEDHYPIAAFDSGEKAEAYMESIYQVEAEKWKKFEGKGDYPDFRYSKENFYSGIVVLEVE